MGGGARLLFGIGMVSMLIGVSSSVFAAEQPLDVDAVTAAENWLAWVDVKDYSRSWDESASYFRQTMTKRKWLDGLEAFRTPLGTLQSRRRVSARPVAQVPGAPEGQYTVVEYVTVYRKKPSAKEMITLVREKDGAWRTAGYSVQ